ncbi:ABC transporter permease [soil metagenome]
MDMTLYQVSKEKQLRWISLLQYLKQIWNARYFWMHLAFSDLRAKFRRSTLGLAWSVLNPLLMTLLLTFILGKVFNTPISDYAPYIFSGLITWEFITSSIIMGCTSFINAEGYIRQFRHPLVIYPLRHVLVALINFSLGFIGFMLWVAIWKPNNYGLATLSLFLTFPLLIIIAWPLAIITAFINTKFRDFAQLIIIVLQAIWYASPIFFEPQLFKNAGIGFLVEYNPIFHILNLIRAPMLYGQFPSLANVNFTLATAAVLWILAFAIIYHKERKLIFYL